MIVNPGGKRQLSKEIWNAIGTCPSMDYLSFSIGIFMGFSIGIFMGFSIGIFHREFTMKSGDFSPSGSFMGFYVGSNVVI